jgi:hypothetical protein
VINVRDDREVANVARIHTGWVNSSTSHLNSFEVAMRAGKDLVDGHECSIFCG